MILILIISNVVSLRFKKDSTKIEKVGMESEKKHKILIVDDVLGNINILKEFLTPEYDTSYLTDSTLAVEKALSEKPDLILLDIMMPEIDGFEVCKLLKSYEELKEIPVIFLTALDESESVVKGFSLGAVDYITKPYHPDELLTRIDTHLRLKESKRIIEQKNNELAELVQILCHDFMTPVSFVLGTLELIREDRQLFDVFEENINKSMINASNLIKLVRTMRSLEDFKDELKMTAISLKDSVNQAADLLQHKLKGKNIEIKIDVDQNLQVIAEETSLVNSVINNLLTNAIKFSYPDSFINVKGYEEDNHVILEIKDTGIGMSERMQDDLFKISRPTSRKGTSGEKGTGYGMHLIKKFTDLYGAEIMIQSKDFKDFPEDHGTSISIKFRKE